MSKYEEARRADQNAHRAAIIRLLVPLYPEGLTFTGLQEALGIERRPMDEAELNFHLALLEEGEYVKLERRERRRQKQVIQRVTVTRKGIYLHDGKIPEDPGIAL